MEYMWIWIKETTGILTLIVASIGVIVSIITFLLLRWQRSEEGQDLRNFLFQQELVRGTLREPGMELLLEEVRKGSKHQWIKKLLKRIFG